MPLRPEKDWPSSSSETGWRRWLYGAKRARTKQELVDEMNAELTAKLPGVDWNFSQNIRDNVMEALSGVKGDNSVKIFGPDLDKLESLADKVKISLQRRARHRERRHLPHQGPDRTWSSASIRRSARSGASARRRQQRHQTAPWAARPFHA